MMKRIPTTKLLLVVAAAYMLAVTDARAQNASAVVLANTCYSCHGTDGRSAGAMPSIAGKSPNYIVRLLKEFRDGKRKATVMTRISKGFSDVEIESLAEYFSTK